MFVFFSTLFTFWNVPFDNPMRVWISVSHYPPSLEKKMKYLIFCICLMVTTPIRSSHHVFSPDYHTLRPPAIGGWLSSLYYLLSVLLSYFSVSHQHHFICVSDIAKTPPIDNKPWRVANSLGIVLLWRLNKS